MKLPPRVLADIGAALAAAGEAGEIRNVRAVGGGCISPAAQLTTHDGASWFVKFADGALPADFFAAEADSLRALAHAGEVRVPAVIAVSERWLLLEWLQPGRGDDADWRELGRALARQHRHRQPEPGWPRANYIGTLPQHNERGGTWAAFWRDRRLAPQLRAARRSERLTPSDERAFAALFARLDELLAGIDEEGVSLLHGDLWHGNVHMLADGGAALVDPSCYYGHREVDLAMSSLFGGFAPAFYDGYRATWPLLPGSAAREPIYQLYYLLVHVNLFGGGYARQTRSALEQALG